LEYEDCNIEKQIVLLSTIKLFILSLFFETTFLFLGFRINQLSNLQ